MTDTLIKANVSVSKGIREYAYNGFKIFLSNYDSLLPFSTHSHEEYEFLYLKGSNMASCINGMKVFAQKGHIIPINSFDIHGQEDSVLSKGLMCITCSCELIDKIAVDVFNIKTKTKFVSKSFLPSSALNLYIGAFIDECSGKKCADNHCLNYLIKLILIEIFRCSNNNIISTSKVINTAILRVINYFNDNCHATFDLQQAADVAGMNKFYFIKKFVQEMQISPQQYLMELKIEKAKDLMSVKENVLTDIAYELGYSSQSHFCMQFKKHTGLTPREYRKIILI